MLEKKGASEELIDKGIIEVIPLTFFRGLSISDAVVLIDETQNISFDIFKTIITRIGENCKYIFLGDVEQVDIRKKNNSCLQTIFELFKDGDLIKTLEFMDEDCVRNPKIPKILEVLRDNNI
jgi:phosphate starvation-inducible PhoH-like protein